MPVFSGELQVLGKKSSVTSVILENVLLYRLTPVGHNFSFHPNCSEEAATFFAMPGLQFLMKEKREREWRYLFFTESS